TGILIAALLRDTKLRAFVVRSPNACGAVMVGLILAALLFTSSPSYSQLQRVAFGISLNTLAAGSIVLFLQVNPNSRLAAVLSQPWLITVGKYSYFLYLMHMPFLRYAADAYSGGSNLLRISLALGITFLGAWASWWFIESRLIGVGKGLLYTTSD